MKKLILTLVAGLLLSPMASAEVLFDQGSALDRHQARVAQSRQGLDDLQQGTGELSRTHMKGTEALCAHSNIRKVLPGDQEAGDGNRGRSSGATGRASRAM